jgi:hypothetical protein
VVARAAEIPPINAVAATIPATNAPANPAAPVILNFIIFLLNLALGHKKQREQHARVDVNTVRPRADYYPQPTSVKS